MNFRLSTRGPMPRPIRNQGLTLIEMLVAIAISFVVILAVGYVFLGSRQTYRVQDAMARQQESARFAYEVLSKEIRLAGLMGCTASTSVNVLNDPSWFGGLQTLPLQGYEAGAGQPAAITGALAGRDSIKILRADNSSEYIVQDHTPPVNANFTLSVPHDLQDGEIIVACDSANSHAAILQITNASGSNVNIVHNSGTGVPGNCSKAIGPGTVCGGVENYQSFTPGSRLMRLSGVAFFIRNNPAGEPSLYRLKLGVSGAQPTSTAEELVEGVEDMQITYGVDTDTAADRQVNEYQTADDVENGTGASPVPGVDAATRWQRALSVRISLLMRTPENGITAQAQSYTYNGTATTATDRRLRRVFTYVITVRNRL